MNELCEFKRNLKAAFYSFNIEDMEEITEFHALKEFLINNEYALPKGQIIKFWNNNKIFFGNQLPKKTATNITDLLPTNNILCYLSTVVSVPMLPMRALVAAAG